MKSRPVAVGAASPFAIDFLVPFMRRADDAEFSVWLLDGPDAVAPASPWKRTFRDDPALNLGPNAFLSELSRLLSLANVDAEVRTATRPLLSTTAETPGTSIPLRGHLSAYFLLRHGDLGHGSWYLPVTRRSSQRIVDYVESIEPARPLDWRRSQFGGTYVEPSGTVLTDFHSLPNLSRRIRRGLPHWSRDALRCLGRVFGYCYGQTGTAERRRAARRTAMLMLSPCHAESCYFPPEWNEWTQAVISSNQEPRMASLPVLEQLSDLDYPSRFPNNYAVRARGAINAVVDLVENTRTSDDTEWRTWIRSRFTLAFAALLEAVWSFTERELRSNVIDVFAFDPLDSVMRSLEELSTRRYLFETSLHRQVSLPLL